MINQVGKGFHRPNLNKSVRFILEVLEIISRMLMLLTAIVTVRLVDSLVDDKPIVSVTVTAAPLVTPSLGST